MGVVYRAHDTTLDRTVALKFLPSGPGYDEEARARFMREALPEPLAGQSGALGQGGQLGPDDVGEDGGEAAEGREAAVGARHHPLATHHP